MLVTSFSAEGYEKYGRHFLQSYITTEQQIPLVVYYEHDQPEKPLLPNITWMPLAEVSGFARTEAFLGSQPRFRGRIEHGGEEKYTFRLDAYKFFRKVFAVHDAYLGASRATKYLAWVDADVTFTRKIPVTLPTLIFPRAAALAYLGRSNLYSETGFMGFNLQEEGPLRRFMMTYFAFYSTAAFLNLKEWHDCMVFDTARLVSAVSAYSLSGLACEDLYPWDDTILQDWMTHNKGPERKEAVYTPADEAA